jgi:hypothetical protein
MSEYVPEEHLHLVDSFVYGWRKLNLVYELEPRGEMPEGPLPGHMIVVAQGDFRGSIYYEGIWIRLTIALVILPFCRVVNYSLERGSIAKYHSSNCFSTRRYSTYHFV